MLFRQATMIISGIILCLSHTFLISDAAFTWIRHDASVDFIQGQTAKLVWTVNVGSGYTWAKVTIYRNRVKSSSGEEQIIDLKKSDGVKNKHLSGREADINLVVQGTSNVVNVTFTLRNLENTTDEKYYRIFLVNSNFDTDSKYTYLRVLDPPKFTRSPFNTTVTQGDTIILHCQATANPPSTISWKRDDNIAIKAGFKTFGNGTLLVHNAKRSDAGKYICTATNLIIFKPNNATATAFVTVKYEPTIVNKSNSLTVKEGGPVKLTCKADGYPAPTITWSKSSGHIGAPNTGEWYNISSVKRSDKGAYTCTASNGIGNNATADIKITVQYKPTIDKAASNTTGTSWNGHSMTLRCKWSTANPAPTWNWYKPDVSNITDKARSIDKGSKVTVTTGQDGYGSYRCEANNVAGSDVHQINVTQLFPPDPPNVTVINIEASSVTVRWTKPAYDAGSPVIDYILEIQPEKGNVTVNGKRESHFVTGLTKDTQYVVKLYARNVVGYGKAANTTFRTKKQGPPGQPIIESAVVNQTSVTLTWLKPANNGGEITGYTIYKKVKDQDSTWTQIVQISGTPFTYRVKNLEQHRTYLLIVTATNRFGESVKDDSKAKIVKIPDATTTPSSTLGPGGGRNIDDMANEQLSGSVYLGVCLPIIFIFLLVIVLTLAYNWWKRQKEKQNEARPNSSSNNNEEAIYMNNMTVQDQIASTVTRNEGVNNQQQHQPTTQLYQSLQTQTPSDTYSSLSPNTKLPPRPAVMLNSGVYQDLQGASIPSHPQYQSLDNFSRV